MQNTGKNKDAGGVIYMLIYYCLRPYPVTVFICDTHLHKDYRS